MLIRSTAQFDRSYAKSPPAIRKAFDKQARLLQGNLGHPSLRAKKYSEAEDRWQARVTRDWRFYFKIVGDTYVLLDIMPHPK